MTSHQTFFDQLFYLTDQNKFDQTNNGETNKFTIGKQTSRQFSTISTGPIGKTQKDRYTLIEQSTRIKTARSAYFIYWKQQYDIYSLAMKD